MGFGIVIWGFVAVVVLGILLSSLKIVREYQRLVVFRLGRSLGARGPGIVFLIPLVDRAVWADLREQFLEIPRQTCITKDNAPIDIDFLIYSRVVEPSLSVIQVRNFAGASQGIATTTLRAVIGDIMLDDVLAKREDINRVLRAKLDEVTERWGVKVTSVEIREIVPPREIQEAMNRQMSAERNRRAMVTESEGKRQSAILVAEGDKQSAILKAEGDRRSSVLRAEGFALSLGKVFGAAKGVDTKTMVLQYLDALKTIGTGPSTKFFFPMELMEFLKPLKSFAERVGSFERENHDDNGSAKSPAPKSTEARSEAGRPAAATDRASRPTAARRRGSKRDVNGTALSDSAAE